MTGICNSTSKLLENGKIRLYEKWQRTRENYVGDNPKGNSILEEI